MKQLLIQFARDEAGFVISAELVLVATITVLAMVVGLSELSFAVNQELEDVASAFGAVSQSYSYYGAQGCKGAWQGSSYQDSVDLCDGDGDIVGTWPEGEAGWGCY